MSLNNETLGKRKYPPIYSLNIVKQTSQAWDKLANAAKKIAQKGWNHNLRCSAGVCVGGGGGGGGGGG